MSDQFLSKLASKGTSFSNFKNLYHPSYPNYLAMIAALLLARAVTTNKLPPRRRAQNRADCSTGRTMQKTTPPAYNLILNLLKENMPANMYRSEFLRKFKRKAMAT